MALKPEVLDITDEEIDALVAAVSDGEDNDDNEDVDFESDNEISTTPESSEQLPNAVSSQSSAIAEQGAMNTSPVSETLATMPATQDASNSSKMSSADKSAEAAKQVPITDTNDSRSSENSLLQSSASTTASKCNVNIETLPRAGQTNEIKSAVSEEAAKQTENILDVTQAGCEKNDIPENKSLPVDGGSPVNDPPLQKPQKEEKQRSKPSSGGGGGWGWGMLTGIRSSVISSATAIGNQVGESFTHVLEKVESTLVEPEDPPNNVARKQDDESRPLSSRDLPPVKHKLHTPGGAVKEQVPSGHQAADQELVTSSEAHSSDRSELGQMTPLLNSTTADELVMNARTADIEMSSGEDDKSIKRSVSQDCEKKNVGASKKWSSNSIESSTVEKNVVKKTPDKDDEDGGWLSGWGFKRVVSTGLGVIGDIGKKTYNALMVDDDEEQQTPTDTKKSSPVKKRSSDSSSKLPAFISSLDDGSGEAHMEALQELSVWSNGLLNKHISSLNGNQAQVVRDDITMIQEAFNLSGMEDLMCDNETDHDFTQLTKDFMSQLGLKLDVQKLIFIQEKSRSYLSELCVDAINPKEVHQNAVKNLAEFTAVSVAILHKIGQLLLIEASVPLLAYKFRSLSIAGLTKVLCVEIWIESNRFARLLNDFALAVGDETSMVASMSLATMVELEASNCSMSLHDACACLLPIMQLVVSRTHPQLTDCSGVPHLESIQICSNMSRTNVRDFLKKLPADARQKFETDLADLEAVFDLGYFQQDEDTDCYVASFSSQVIELIKLVIAEAEPAAAKLIATHERVTAYLTDCANNEGVQTNQRNAKDIHQMAVQLLSDLTASVVELFYSIAQLILLDKPHNVKLYAQKAENLASLTKLLCIEIGNLSTQFTHCLSNVEPDGPEAATPFVTNVYLEASSNSTHIQDGFHLLLPVFQLAFIKACPLVEEPADGS